MINLTPANINGFLIVLRSLEGKQPQLKNYFFLLNGQSIAIFMFLSQTNTVYLFKIV